MKKMFTFNSKSRSRWMLLLLLLVAGVTNTLAQDVTIRGNNGSCVAAVKNGGVGDTFFNVDGFATWQHEQLNMVLTTSDGTKLTPNGQLDNPANNLFKSSDGTKMQIAHGQVSGANVCYLSVSLPKGYRFTEYMIEFSRPYNLNKGRVQSGWDWDYVTFNSTNGNSSIFGETNSTFNTYVTQATVTTGGANQTIKRKEVLTGEKSDMGNVLYFKLELPTNERTLIQLENATFYFTSEENYSPVAPAIPMIEPMTAVDVPFATSKVDFGAIENNTYNGKKRVSYSSANVHDLQAYFTLYEEKSVEAGTGIDGVSGDVVKYSTGGTISSVGGYFKLGKTGEEQKYYIETPTYVEISDAESHKVPVGYRIVGAEFEYTKSLSAVATRTFYITYQGENRNYYLDRDGHFTTSPTLWQMDKDGYISSNGYYLYFNQGYAATQRQKPGNSERFGINENGIFQLQWPSYYICFLDQVTTDWWGNESHTRYGLISKDSGLRATVSNEQTTSTETSSVGDFTLNVYDKTGASVAQTRSTANGDTEKITLTGLNNDAVMFGVKGIGLVRATLTLQALDPYLNRMEVVCSDPQLQVPTGEKDEQGKPIMGPLRIEQNFTAQDFSVNGGKFHFYLPAECNKHTVAITFENLYSRYLDASYVGGSAKNTSRLNFVKSDHYNMFGASQNSLYKNTSEASDPKKERQKVGTVGTAKFKFNNADEVGTSGGTMREYPFSLENYAANPNNGSFGPMEFTVSETDQDLTRYVFTTDETAYNIAPTTAVQHRAYAFYEMEVHVQSSTYTPNVAFNKIYSQTLNGAGETKPYYGVTVTATDDAGKAGYASTADVFKIIEGAIKAKTATGTVTEGEGDQEKEIGKYTGWESTFTNANQLLYFDFSNLAGVYQIGTGSQQSMEDFSNTNAKNCLFFIPKGGSAPNNNVAYATGTAGIFHAANDIVLTDKEPFYSPYQIEAESQNKIEYKRLITTDSYGKVQNASLILPFALKLEGGKHTNADGTSFSLHTMQSGQTLTVKDGQLVAYFPAMNDVEEAAANTPYLVKIDENSSAGGVSFTVSQTGGTIMPSTSMAADYTFSGTAVTSVVAGGNSLGAGNYNFTPKGTYAGQQVPKAQNIFYFAKNLFVNSKDYKYDAINVRPFRAYFATPSSYAKLANFGITFEEATGISSLSNNPDLMVVPGNGVITMTSTIEQNVRVHSTSGMVINNAKLQAGETRTINVPAGIYVINGVKIIVK